MKAELRSEIWNGKAWVSTQDLTRITDKELEEELKDFDAAELMDIIQLELVPLRRRLSKRRPQIRSNGLR